MSVGRDIYDGVRALILIALLVGIAAGITSTCAISCLAKKYDITITEKPSK